MGARARHDAVDQAPERLPQQTLQAVKHFAALAEAIASQRDLKATLRAYSDHMPGLLPFQRTSISIVTDDTRITWHIERGGKIEEIQCTSSPQHDSLVALVMSRGGVLVNDIGKTAPHFSEEQEMLAAGSRSLISHPLVLAGQVIGTINIESERPHAYSHEDKPIIQLVASQIAIALDRAKLFQQQAQAIADVGDQLVRAGKLATVGQLAAVVAHEIRNKFNSILLGARFLQATANLASRSDESRTLEAMTSAVGQGMALMQEFLRYARPTPPRRVAFRVEDLLHEALNLAKRANVRTRWGVPSGLDLVLGDPNQLIQVFVNLVLNAIDAMPHGGELRVCAKAQDGNIDVRVTDTGVGIRPENLPHIFEPFFTTKEGGTGLGMSISKAIVESNGGTIAVRSEPGKGTTFSVQLPIAPAIQPTSKAHGRIHHG